MSSRNEQIFLSYAKEDLQTIKKVYKGLIDRDLNVWFDEENLKPGKWRPQILKAIPKSRYFILCLSSAALRKTGSETPGFQDEELQIAFEIALAQPETSFTIVPVRIEQCGRGDHRIAMHQTYDLFNNFDKDLDKLSLSIGGTALSNKENQIVLDSDELLIKSLYGKAVAFSFAGDHKNAKIFYDSLLSLEPENTNAIHNRGAAYSHLGDLHKAIQDYTEAIRINHLETMAYHNRGMALGQLGRTEDALRDFDKTIEQCDTFPHVWSNRAKSLMDLGRNEEALVSVNKALEIAPDFGEAWCNKGHILFKLNRKKEAYEAFHMSSEILPDLLQNWSLKGYISHEKGNFDDAILNYNKALSISPLDLTLHQLNLKAQNSIKPTANTDKYNTKS